MILATNKINKSFGVTEVLKDVSIKIEDSEKVALVGVNGAGKSTLFKILINQMTQDTGDVSFKKGAKIGYLAQINDVFGDETIIEVVNTAFEEVIKLEEELQDLQMQIANNANDEALLKKYDNVSYKFESLGGYSYKSYARGALIGLGFPENEFDRVYETLSGGEKTRVLLAKLLISDYDLLLLDEPTNHLDIKAVEWLENYIKSSNCAFFVISHDRYFLDNFVTSVIELEHGIAKTYNGNYTDFSVQKEIDYEIQLAKFVNQQKEIARQEEVIRTLRSYNREKSVKRANSREKLLNKMERVDKPFEVPKTMSLEITPQVQSGNDVLTVTNLEKSFDNRVLFSDVDFEIKRGDKVAIVGDNGAGKSTLIKIITKNLEQDKGEIKYGTNVNIAYYDQETENLDYNNTIFEEISNSNPKMTIKEIRNALATFVFIGDEVLKKISTLSGGERGRVALCKLMLSSSNLLILDEPTNHLDMFSREVLENAINKYAGTVLFISHDRYFITNVASSVFHLTNKTLNKYMGNYEFFVEKTSNFDQVDVKLEGTTNISNMSNSKSEFLNAKEKQAKERKRIRDIEKIEKKIEDLELQKSEIDIEFTKEEVFTNPDKTKELFDKKSNIEETLRQLYLEWEQLV